MPKKERTNTTFPTTSFIVLLKIKGDGSGLAPNRAWLSITGKQIYWTFTTISFLSQTDWTPTRFTTLFAINKAMFGWERTLEVLISGVAKNSFFAPGLRVTGHGKSQAMWSAAWPRTRIKIFGLDWKTRDWTNSTFKPERSRITRQKTAQTTFLTTTCTTCFLWMTMSYGLVPIPAELTSWTQKPIVSATTIKRTRPSRYLIQSTNFFKSIAPFTLPRRKELSFLTNKTKHFGNSNQTL